ncbi:MAG: hypothetical protein WCO25_01005 [Candidatus Uhrbacteria bacterium]
MLKEIGSVVGIAIALMGSGCVSDRVAELPRPAAVTVAPTTDATATGWKTYASDGCGVSFRYPSDWTVSKDSETRIALTKPNVDGGERAPGPYDHDAVLYCWADLKEVIAENVVGPLGTSSTTITEYLTANADGSEVRVREPATIDGQRVIEQIVGGYGVTDQLWIERDGIYLLSFPGVSDSSALTADDQTILSSLAFTGTPVSMYDADSYWQQPTRLAVDGACVDRDANGAVVGPTKGCDDFGETQLANGMRARFLPDPTDKTKIQLAFFDGPNEWTASRLTLAGDEMTNLSDVSVDIVGVVGAWIFVESHGGLEGGVGAFVYGPTGWHALSVWDTLKATFPDTMEPPFSFRLATEGKGELLVTEQNGIGGPAYSESPESLRLSRIENRMRYVLRMTGDVAGVPTFEVVRSEKIPR